MNKFSSTIHRLSCGIDVIARVRKDAHGSTSVLLYRPDTCQEAVIPTQPLEDFRFDSPGIESFVNLHKDFLRTSGFFLSKVDMKAKTETVLTLEPSAVEDIYSLLGTAQKWSSCLDDTEDLQNCIDSAKRCIALGRKELRRGRVSLINLNVQPLKETISAAYRVLGEINIKKGLLNKAAACFTLSLHSNGNSTEEESCIRSILSSVLQNDCVSSESIKVKELKNIDDRAAFSCTMCGECCRNPNSLIPPLISLWLSLIHLVDTPLNALTAVKAQENITNRIAALPALICGTEASLPYLDPHLTGQLP